MTVYRIMKGKDNIVPLLDSELRRDGSMHYKLQQLMYVSGHFHIPAALPPGKNSRSRLGRRLCGP